MTAPSVGNDAVRDFSERHPAAAEAIATEPGTPEFFAAFDRLREAEECEPYDFSNRIHGL